VTERAAEKQSMELKGIEVGRHGRKLRELFIVCRSQIKYIIYQTSQRVVKATARCSK
jgi:hypothetical protein